MKRACAVCILLSTLFISQLFAQQPNDDWVVFGEKRFNRTTGDPNKYTEHFTIPIQSEIPCTIEIINGDDKDAGNRVSSATVVLNGKTICTESDFNQNVGKIYRDVILKKDNKCEVTVKGKPGCHITINCVNHLQPIYPIVECIQKNSNGSYTAHFGYNNNNSHDVVVPAGPLNHFLPPPIDRGQPTVFKPGRQQDVFTVVFDGRSLEWEVRGREVKAIYTSSIACSNIDTTAPSLSVTSPADGLITSGSTVQVTGTVADASPIMVTINGTTVDASNGTFSSVASLQEGMNIITVIATDAAGNSTTIKRNVRKDTNPPVLTVDSPAESLITNLSAVTVSGKVTDETAVTLTVKGNSVPVGVGGVFSYQLSVTEGLNTITIVTTDAAGNQTKVTRTVRRDTQPPVLTISSPIDSSITNLQSITVSGIAADSTTVTLNINGNSVTVGTGGVFSYQLSVVEGMNTITAVATDAAGNKTTVTRTVRRDNQPPALVITQPLDGLITNQITVTVIGTVTDETSVRVMINGNPINLEQGGVIHSTISLAEGLNTITIIAKDTVNNQTTVTRTVKRDTQSPIVNLTSPIDSLITSQLNVTVSGTVVDSTAVTLTINGNNVPVGVGGVFSYQLSVAEGMNTIIAVATDAAGNQSTVRRTVRRDTQVPIVDLRLPIDNFITNQQTVVVSGTVTDSTAVTLTINGAAVQVGTGGVFSYQLPVVEGLNTISVVATDAVGNQTTIERSVRRDSTPPIITIISPIAGFTTLDSSVTIQGRVTDSTKIVFSVNDIPQILGADGSFMVQTNLVEGWNNVVFVATDAASNTSTSTLPIKKISIPSVPSLIAPPLDSTVIAVPMASAVEFLYKNQPQVQTGVDTTKLNKTCIGVIRGKVTKLDGSAFSGVKITMNNYPEFGQTLSRADGMFDMVVNGSNTYTVNYKKDGYFSATRDVEVDCNLFVYAETVALIQPDTQVTTISFTQPFETAKSSVVQDKDGVRQVVLAFEQGTQAQMVLENDSVVTLPQIHVRATEYTVGPNGPNAMPLQLPPTSGYTYCANVTADEAIAANAKRIRFTKPVMYYVDNFIGFPVGMRVPCGYEKLIEDGKLVFQWVALDDGRVIQIVDIVNGCARIAVDSAGFVSDSARLTDFGINDAERCYLATLYGPGQSIMRTPINYFGMYDFNCGVIASEGAEQPMESEPDASVFEQKYPPVAPSGSVRGVTDVLNQKMERNVQVTGAPFTMHYTSEWQPGRKSELFINVSGDTLPPGVKRIVIEVNTAGQVTKDTLSAIPNQTYHYIWDGKDGYGREDNGEHLAKIKIGYVYNGNYQAHEQLRKNFALATGERLPLIRSRQDVTLSQTLTTEVGSINQQGMGNGGWMVSEKNELNLETASLYFGNGQKKMHSTSKNGVQHVPAIDTKSLLPPDDYSDYNDIKEGPDGSIYVLRGQGGSRVVGSIVRIAPDNTASLIAGGWPYGFPIGTSTADSIPAVQAKVSCPYRMAFDAQGNLYYGEGYYALWPSGYDGGNRIRKIDRNGIVTTIAGGITRIGFGGDGGPASQALLNYPYGIAISASGNIYFADGNNCRIRCIGTDGIITTVAGGGTKTQFTEGMIATEYKPNYWVNNVAVGLDGSVFFTAYAGFANGSVGVQSIFKLGTDGRLYLYGGALKNFPFNSSRIPEGTPAKEADIGMGYADVLTIDNQGLVNFTSFRSYGRYGLYKIDSDGKVRMVIGGGKYTGSDIIGKAQLEVDIPVSCATFGKYGNTYFIINGSSGSPVVFQIAPTTLSLVDGKYEVPSTDGSEIYIFDENGKHIQTLNALTRRMLMTFIYDANGRLSEVMDKDSLTSHIERDPSGYITAIISPKGERTQLSVDSTGMLSGITNPNGEQVRFRYSEGGLMSSIIAPSGGEQEMAYDSLGRLISASTAETPASHLSKTLTPNGYTVTSTSPTGISSMIDMQQTPSGAQTLTGTDPYGRQTVASMNTSGVDSLTTPDGTCTITQRTYDPRYGTQVPIAANTTVRLPSGLTSVQTQSRTVTLLVGQEVLGLTDITNINGRAWTTVRDGIAQTITQTSPEGRREIFYLNDNDQTIKDSIPGIAATYYSYNADGKVSSTWQAGRITSYSYDSKDRLLSTTDPIGRKDSTFYDNADRVVRQVFPDGNEVRYSYDANGNMLGLTPPDKPAHIFAYDKDNKPTIYLPPILNGDTTATRYAYDLEGRLKRTIYPDSSMTSVEYDSIDGKVKRISYDYGVLSIAYDSSKGNIKQIVSGNNTLSYTYDGSFPLSETWGGIVNGSVNIKYDNNFRKICESINATDSVIIQYDRDNLPTRIGRMGMNYNAANNLLMSDTVGNTINEYSYDTYSDLATKTTKIGTNVLYQLIYTRDSLARIIRKDETISGILTKYSYKYETSGRLSEVKRNDTLISIYIYDSNGNRLYCVAGTDTIRGKYDVQDEIVSHGNVTYTYTASGSLKTKTEGNDTTRYTYDALGNLLSAFLPDGNLIEYVVDGANRRIAKKVNGSIVSRWIYSGGLSPIAELDSTGKILARYVGNYMVKNDTTYRIITDQLGSTRFVVNAQTGAVVQEINYDEFGNIKYDSNPGFTPFYFAGGLYDSQTKLTRFGARDYDSKIGRWTTSDPIGFSGGDANLYSYCFLDPVNRNDFNGRRTGASEVATLTQTAIIVGQSIAASALLYQAWAETMSDACAPFVFRVWGGTSPLYGQYWTLDDPLTARGDYRSQAGLPNSNTGEYLAFGQLINETGVIYSHANPYEKGQVGGWQEVFVPNPVSQIRLISTTKVSPPF
jgi:RHS repeat-associated protein